MAAVLKKRALAEYNTSFPECAAAKKLHLAKKQPIGISAAAFVGLLEKCKTSNEALQLLLRISDCLQFQETDIEEAIKKLSEHFVSEKESAVRVKILWLFLDIGLECPGANLSHLIDETTQLLKNETSHKVIVQGLATLLKLGKKLSSDKILCHRLVSLGKEYLKDTSQLVKCACLQLISELYPINAEADNTTEIVMQANAVVKLLADYTHSQDARVRSEVFNALGVLSERGLTMSPSLYKQACLGLKDDYDIVRQAALRMVWFMGNKYPEIIVKSSEGETSLRLVDDAFVRICSAVTDLCMQVRAIACSLLGTMKLVSDHFLQQTLDKQLMSNMKTKRSGHERNADLLRTGEWSAGRRWGDDTPGALMPADSVSLLPAGAAGALVHGLEDEFLEVRTAAVDAVCSLSLENTIYAKTALDFMVDMFNDEIEEVRMRAIDSLTNMSLHIVLREDQLETVLGALEDFSMDVREGLHRMLSSCTLSSKTCLEMCVDKILENLKRYPQDKRSTFRCVRSVGASHAPLVLPLVTKLLNIHPFFDLPQPDVDDPTYICVLILVLNAAANCNTILPLLEEHTIKHYSYLRDTMPHLVPYLPLGEMAPRSSVTVSEKDSADAAVLRVFAALAHHAHNHNLSSQVRLAILRSAEEHLDRLAEIEPLVSGAANFTALFARCVRSLHAALNSLHGPTIIALQELNINCLRLQHQFSGTTPLEVACARQLHLRVSALQLCAQARDPSASALPAAHAHITRAEALDRYLADVGVEPDPFTISVFQQLSLCADPKPGALARAMHPLLLNGPLPTIPRPNIKVHMCVARVIEPARESDTVLRFAAGLVTAVALEAELIRVPDRSALRLRVTYPDRRTHQLLPQKDHLRPLDHQHPNEGGTENLRLLTKVLISHGVWTEPCGVDISLCIAVSEEGSGKVEPTLLDLCKPVRVTVAPKPIKRGI